MDAMLKQKALDKVPDLAAELMNYYGADVDIEQVVELYTEYGKLWTVDRYVIGEYELLRHVKLAKQKHFDITVSDTEVTVKRILSNGDYYLVHYRPYKN